VDPAKLASAAAPLLKTLEKGKELRIRHENGTDLTLGLAGYKGRATTGRLTPADLKRPFGMMVTLPAGGLRVPLNEKVADGTIVGNRTCYYDDGKATDPVFNFSGGKLIDYEFGSGTERFEKPFAKATKGKDQPGMIGIGLNPALHDTPQLEDNEAGAVMVTLGGNKFVGGKNPSDFFGWAITAGARIEVDGTPLKLPG
jgi:leucyl aminopeptidase (aminopeptidase T)